MVQLRSRNTRQRVRPQDVQGSEDGGDALLSDEDHDFSAGDSGESSASADEWRPPTKKATAQDRRGGRRRLDEEEESTSDESEGELQPEDEELVKRPPKRKRGKITLKAKAHQDTNAVATVEREPTHPIDADAITAVEDEEARREADRMWQEVRARTANAPGARESAVASSATITTSRGIQNRAASGLDQWLGLQPPEWPSTCPEAMINDRDSLFVGFVYALNTPSQATITQCLSHLTKVVHPQMIPTERLPPAMRHLSAQRRGATHDMYAWRCLALKQGRTGLGGPEDFGMEEGQEDDGEKFGSKEIAKAIRVFGATDVLLVVSRWYGGVMLGPVRFRHIEDCAKAALARHMVNEAMAEFREELKQLDAQVAELRSASTPSRSAIKAATYDDLVDPDRAERLIAARKKQIELLKRPTKSSQVTALMEYSATAATQTPRNVREQTHGIGDVLPEEEEAMLQAVNEAEAQAASQAQNAVDNRTVADITETVEAASPSLNIKQEPVEVGNNDETTEASELPLPPVKEEQTAHPSQMTVATAVVKEEDEEADLTGWDEL